MATDHGTVTCVVLCGGLSRRFGGGDKTAAAFNGSTVLDHLLDEIPADMRVICVGDQRPTRRPVDWIRESPPGGGPVAGIAAALNEVDTALVAIVAGDMPYAARGLPALLAALRDSSVSTSAVATDPGGHRQPLLSLHHAQDLRQAMPDAPDGVPVRRVLDALPVEPVKVDDHTAADIDTRDHLTYLESVDDRR